MQTSVPVTGRHLQLIGPLFAFYRLKASNRKVTGAHYTTLTVQKNGLPISICSSLAILIQFRLYILYMHLLHMRLHAVS